MSRKPDTPCSRCGKLLFRGTGSRPSGQMVCLACRRAAPKYQGFRPRAQRARLADRHCETCSRTFTPNGTGVQCFCGAVCRNRQPKVLARWRRKNQVRRHRSGGSARQGMTIDQLGERDWWRCVHCRRRVSSILRFPHPRSASFEHLVPVSDGGTDDPANLALAHLACNLRRGVGGIVQLALVG